MPKILSVDKYVLVKFRGKRTTKFYAEKLIGQEEEEWKVSFLRKTRNDKFIWPKIEDISVIEDQDIELLLPEPKIDHWGQLSFDITFDV